MAKSKLILKPVKVARKNKVIVMLSDEEMDVVRKFAQTRKLDGGVAGTLRNTAIRYIVNELIEFNQPSLFDLVKEEDEECQ